MNIQLTEQFQKNFKKHGTGPETFRAFIEVVYDYYRTHGRSFPWRETHDAYEILVSEIMLQQTQTDRVVPKYEAFLEKFSSVHELAKAPQSDVLLMWQGLGYNRRALALHKSAKKCSEEFEGVFPHDRELLQTFPGIGPYTSSAVCAFAFNQPSVFIETNIRTVFLYYFFPEQAGIHDNDLMPLIEATVDQDNPREWYYALMDLGAKLKKIYKNPNRRSKHYTKQSKFEGSNRQVRGLILKALAADTVLKEQDFFERINRDTALIKKILQQLEKEGFLQCVSGSYMLQH